MTMTPNGEAVKRADCLYSPTCREVAYSETQVAGKSVLRSMRWVLPIVRVIAGIRGRAIPLSQKLRKHRSFLGPVPLSEGVTHPLFLTLTP
jgi:hypothetical protein